MNYLRHSRFSLFTPGAYHWLFLAIVALAFTVHAQTTIFNCSSGFASTGSCGVSLIGGSGQAFAFVGGTNGSTAPFLNGTQANFLVGGASHAVVALNYTTAVNVQAFSSTYTFIPNGWNISLVLQNNTSASGTTHNFAAGAGCEAGFYQGFGTNPFPTDVFGLELDSYSPLSSGSFTYSSAQVYQQGQNPCGTQNPLGSANSWSTPKISTSPVPLNSPSSTVNTSTGDTYSATVTYDGTTLTLNMYDVTASGSCPGASCFTQSWANINIPSLVGSNTAWLGLVGSTNLPTAYNLVVPSFTYTVNTAPSSPSHSTYTTQSYMGGSYAAAPTYSPVAGSYVSAQTVSLSSTTPGNNICYIASPTTPSVMPQPDNQGGCLVGTLYSGPITVSSSETIYAMAGTTYTGLPSAFSTAAYTISGSTASTPTFSPVAGTYAGTQTVTISSTTPGASITYCTGVSCTPTTSYTGPVTVSSNQTVGAFATASGYTQSSTNYAAYIITLVTAVENLGSANASVASSGLGFNLTSGSLQEVQLAAAAGATHARVQCGWTGVENQTAPPNNNPGSPQFTLNSNCQTDLTNYKAYGIHPTLLAAYGPPYHQIMSVVVPSGAAVGATSLTLQFSSGIGGDTITSLKPLFDNILTSGNGYISNNHSYAGTLIIAVTPVDATHATVTLASAVTTALPANTTTQYLINEGLYVSPLTSGSTDTSVIAYTNYAKYLASQINAQSLVGEVELWNQPPWAGDPWDNRGDFYDTWPGNQSPGPLGQSYPNPGFVAALQSSSPYAGVTYNWGGTEKSGFNTIPNLMPSNTGVAQTQPAALVNTESFHPYGNNPEDDLWSLPCLRTTLNTYPTLPSSYAPCNLVSGSPSNEAYAPQYTLYQQSNNAAYGVAHNITETGIPNTGAGDPAHQARLIMRQYLGYQVAGVSPIQFYRLYDNSGSGFGFVNSSYVPYPAYTAIQGLMADLAMIKGAPHGSPPLPSVTSYSGAYQLDTAAFVGTQPGTTTNGILYAVWQQSTTTGTWSQLAQPTAVPVTVALPSGTVVQQLVNLDTRASVAFTQSGQSLTFNVSDDPIEVLTSGPANSTLSNGTVSNGTLR